MDPNQFTAKLGEILQLSKEYALELAHSEIRPVHVALVMLEKDVGGIAQRLCNKIQNADARKVIASLRQIVAKIPSQSPPPIDVSASASLMTVLRAAQQKQKKDGDSFLSVDHVLRALAVESSIKDAFSSGGVTPDSLEQSVKDIRAGQKVDSRSAEQTFDALSKYATNLTSLARSGKLDPVIGRHSEIDRVVRILSRRTKNNAILVGPPGTGKTAIAAGLSHRIAAGDVPKALEADVFSLDMGALIAGASHRGEFEERLKAVVNECEKAKESGAPVILFIDEIHTLMGAGSGGSGTLDAANLLKPALAKGDLRCIGATTIDEYRKYVEKDKAFARRFQLVDVKEPTVEDTVSILRGLKESLQTYHGVQLLDSSIVMAARLAKRYITTRFLPDSAIDLVDEAAAALRVQLDSQPEEIDRLERRKLQLEIEATAMKQEKDQASKQRLEKVQKELADIEEQLRPLQMKHQGEKSRLEEIRRLRNKIQEVQQKIVAAERVRDLNIVADLRYGALPDLENALENKIKEDAIAKSNEEDRVLTEIVTPSHISDVVSRVTGIPSDRLRSSEQEKLLKLAERLEKRVIGQETAVKAVSDAILRARAGLAPPNRPIGSFLFLGSTGTGKTELSKALCYELFDDEKNIVRIDASEYMEQHSVSRLIGAPPGYVGYDEGGQLTEAVRRRPYSVVLIDEVEKAHRDVTNIFLQLLDDGRLTDGQGTIVDFTNTVVIFTSNLGAQHLLNAARGEDDEYESSSSSKKRGVEIHEIDEDDSYDMDLEERARKRIKVASKEEMHKRFVEAKKLVMKDVKSHFRPELLNRLDEIVIFEPLNASILRSVVELQLSIVMKRLEADRGIKVSATKDALDRIVTLSYDPAYGARPIRRFIERTLATELSKKILMGSIPDRSIVTISNKGENIPLDGVKISLEDNFELSISPPKDENSSN